MEKTNSEKVASPQSSQDLTTQFEILLRQVSAIIKKGGIDISPMTKGTHFESFTRLGPTHQLKLIKDLQNYIQICQKAEEEEGISVNSNDHSLTWYAMKAMGLRPSSQLFEHLEEDDIVEIYNTAGIQIFRSVSFFSLVSYSLEEVLTYEWSQLYHRDPEITKVLEKIFMDVALGKKDLVKGEVPEHYVSEIFSGKEGRRKMRHNLAAPLFSNNNQIGGVIVAFKIVS